MDHDEYLDHSPGSGAMSEEEALINSDARYESDGRSEMETTFYGSDDGTENGVLMSDGRRRPWSYLRKQHEGHYEDNHSERSRKANIRRDAATFCNYVNLTKHQQRRVLYHVDELDLNEFGQTSSEAIVLALIAYVANCDDRWLQREDPFQELCETLEIDSEKVKKVQRKVRQLL